MSWLDPERSQEPASDSALRQELRTMLGMKPVSYFETEPTPELIALADDLRREALRRNRTARKRSHWMLMAAVVPLAMAFGGVSLWGIAQKHKAEDLAAAIQVKEGQLAALAASAAKHQDDHLTIRGPQPLLASHGKPGKAPKGKELVIPIEHPAGQIPQDTTQVKAH